MNTKGELWDCATWAQSSLSSQGNEGLHLELKDKK